MARLLIFSTNYAPEVTGTAPYVTGVARSLAAAGHEVHVVAGLPHYPGWRLARGTPRRLRWTEVDEGVTIHRRAHYIPARPSAVRRGIYEATFLLQGLLGLPAAADAVIGIVPGLSDGLLARTAAAWHGVPYGLVFQDLMGRAAEQSGASGGARVAAVTRRAEGIAARGATRIGIITPSFAPYLESLGVPRGRIVTLRNWSRALPDAASRDIARARLGWGSDFVALHTGNIGLKQGLEQVVDAAALAGRRGSRVRFVLVGDGNQRDHIVALGADLLALDVRPLVPASELADLLAAADALLISERASLLDMSLPSKLTTYLAAGRPIVAAIPPHGVTAEEIARTAAGIVVPAGDPAALVDALEDLAADAARAERLGQAGTRYALEELEEGSALRRYSSFVDELLGSRPPGRLAS